MDTAEVRRVVREYVTKEYVEEGYEVEITDATPLISGGLVDSFTMVSLKRFLEKTYGIRIPDAEATPDAFDSVTRIADLVVRIRAAASAPA